MPTNSGYPNFYVGQRLTASLLASAQPLQAWKIAGTGRTTTTVSGDTDLTLPVEANALYDFECFLYYTGAINIGIKIRIILVTGATGTFGASGLGGTSAVYATDQMNAFTEGSDITFGSPATPTPTSAYITGTVDTAGTAGNCTLGWAQGNAGSGTNTTLQAGSWMRLTRRE